jgi:transcription-repair coupling factor (superfamily II helicase)
VPAHGIRAKRREVTGADAAKVKVKDGFYNRSFASTP